MLKLLPMKIPEEVKIEELTDTYGRFIFEPLERGFGTTIGNSLRRALLSSIQSTAITGIRIEGVLHEFSTIEGVLEDIPEIVLNLKQVKIKLLSGLDKRIKWEIKKKGEIKAGDIPCDGTFEITNPEQHIMTVTDRKDPIKMELFITSGRGYVPVELLKTEYGDVVPVDTIFIDGIYSPVTKANFRVENVRIGQRSDYEKLILEVWTDGRVNPKEAVAHAAINLLEYFNKFRELSEEKEYVRLKEMTEEERKLLETLKIRIDDLDVSQRAKNCLRKAGIKTLFDLATKKESELLQIENLGRKTLSDLQELLKRYNLRFGMEIPQSVKEKYLAQHGESSETT